MSSNFIKSTIGVAVLFHVLAGSVAVAAWTGSGTEAGHTDTSSPPTTLDVSGSTKAHLYPGATGVILLKIDNRNPYKTMLIGIAADGAITSDKGALCDAATGVTYTPPASLSLVLPPHTAVEFGLGSVVMTDASADACQGATFTVPLQLTTRS
jgi:hypothetical protein